jgi:alkaline phosphatase
VLAVGDIARCDGRGDERTAAITAGLLRSSPKAPLLLMGDLAYPDGSSKDFASCYRPSWGRFDAQVRPVPGNHEYRTAGASGYFDYFGKAAGPRGKGWYSFDVRSWHVVALNSNCDEVGCGPGSAQVRWLRADLARHRSRCTLAYWHHPRFSSGEHGGSPEVAALWTTLEAAGADVVLNGHDHDYERFAPQRSDGRASASGIREFVVGTGGAKHRAFAARARNSQKRVSHVDAVLQLRLRDGGYRWALVGTAGAGTPLDAGTGTCS